MLSMACLALCLASSAGLKFDKREDSASRYGAVKDGLELNVHHKVPKGKAMKDLTEDEVTIAIAVGRKKFHFDIVKTGDRTGTLNFEGTEDTLTNNEKQQLRTFSNDVLEDKRPANGRVNFGSKLMEYLSHMPEGKILKNKTMAINVRALFAGSEKPAPSDKTNSTHRSRRLLAQDCNGVYVDSPEAGSPCPTVLARPSDWYFNLFKTWYSGDDGQTCMCPYGGGGLWPAYYSGADGVYRWSRKHGSDTASCKGRCGMGCADWDKEAFQDCFDHDICGSHYGGSAFWWDADCGDEFEAAMDDWAASHGWSCCTSSAWDQFWNWVWGWL